MPDRRRFHRAPRAFHVASCAGVPRRRPAARLTLAAPLAALLAAACADAGRRVVATTSGGAVDPAVGAGQPRGDSARGRDVFRFETFGNEGFWTGAARAPQGMAAAKVTPLQAMAIGLSVDIDAVDSATRRMLAEQLRADPSGRTSALLNDPATTVKLVNANAVIGLALKAGPGGITDVTRGARIGVTCALCHSVTDGSAFRMPNGGSAGHRVDGPTNHDLDVGAVLATAANSRALFPLLQLTLKANGGKTYGRAPTGLTAASTEAEVDAYLKNRAYYPVGMFDDTPDGNGEPMHITPFFRQDLAAPFGSGGEFATLEDFNNLVFSVLFDVTELTTPGGRAFLHKLGGAAGDEIADEYVKVLAATNVTGYPFVQTRAHGEPGSQDGPIGRRVDDGKLQDLSAYLVSLPAPRGTSAEAGTLARGAQLFVSSGCTGCHNADQSRPVRTEIIPMARIFPGDRPVVLAPRTPPLTPVEDTPGNPFDDKMAIVNASLHGGVRGIALPLLLDLARKPVFLHDNSVPSLDRLLDPARGATAPHPFFVADAGGRSALVAYLRSLDTSTTPAR